MRIYWAILAAVLLYAPSAQAATPTYLVTQIELKGGVESRVGELLDELLLTRVQQRTGAQTFGMTDVQQMLGVREQQMLVGCEDDACMADIGGALGADRVVAGSVGLIGTQYLLNMKLIDARRAVVLQRASRKVERDTEQLVEALEETVVEILPAPPSRPWWPWAAAGAGLAAAGTAAAMGALALQASDDAKSATRGQPYEEARAKTRGFELGFGIAGAVALAAVTAAVIGFAMERGTTEATEIESGEKPAARFAPLVGPRWGAALEVRW